MWQSWVAHLQLERQVSTGVRDTVVVEEAVVVDGEAVTTTVLEIVVVVSAPAGCWGIALAAMAARKREARSKVCMLAVLC